MLQSPTVSSASILLAIITALYGLFYPAIKEVIDMEILQHPNEKNNKPLYVKADNVYTSKVKPLVIGVSFILVIFLPECLAQIVYSCTNLIQFGIAGTSYDFTIAAFLAVTLFTSFQTWNIWNAACKVFKKRKGLKAILDSVAPQTKNN